MCCPLRTPGRPGWPVCERHSRLTGQNRRCRTQIEPDRRWIARMPRVLPRDVHARIDADALAAAAADGLPAGAGPYRAGGDGPDVQLRHRHGDHRRAEQDVEAVAARSTTAGETVFDIGAHRSRASAAAPSPGSAEAWSARDGLDRHPSWLTGPGRGPDLGPRLQHDGAGRTSSAGTPSAPTRSCWSPRTCPRRAGWCWRSGSASRPGR